MNGYWNFDFSHESLDTDGVRATLDRNRLLDDILTGMRKREEEETLHIVIQWLRANGYTVEKNHGSS